MAAIIMQSTLSNKRQIIADYPSIHFIKDTHFRWSPTDICIHYDEHDEHLVEHLLHEVAHFELGHKEYSRDVALITMERAAWTKAAEIASRYRITVNETLVQDDLDTYRDWLHARSTCPTCQANGFQTDKVTYSCSACRATWRVNQAFDCALRRYVLPQNK